LLKDHFYTTDLPVPGLLFTQSSLKKAQTIEQSQNKPHGFHSDRT
jgi:hypothetical protein